MKVSALVEPLIIPTYPVGEPEKNPLFFEKRVYQGSNGKVYPVPFIDKVYDSPVPVEYQSLRLENDFVRLVMLPEIGGRIFTGQDKMNNDYDFFYRQDVIKPALVGLAGPWISGGVEFNWPQHHRPGTFMPTDFSIEEEADGAKTVWMSEHDPINRLKGMHGIRLRPNSSLIELRARLYNRTPFTQSFLWWANVAAMVHDQYQSFFPPDVHYVADHAVRAMSSFPLANHPYYGVDYQNRPGNNDLSWYKNIPVPTSYMVCETMANFFGGYDFKHGGGFIHVADRHIAPGKKQWTWGNHPFGWAWDRELTDQNGPYVELMAGVYTDNQPDFSYLAPYETKTFSQFWWPIQGIGPVQEASENIALRLVVREDRIAELAIAVSSPVARGRVQLLLQDRALFDEEFSLLPSGLWQREIAGFTGENQAALCARVFDAAGALLLEFRPVDEAKLIRTREVATEPLSPEQMISSDELYLTGEHLEQYRHPTRAPEIYWQEALRRDDGDSRCNIAMGRRALKSGNISQAADYFRKAINRLTHRHPNPETGEAHYFMGLTAKFQGANEQAYEFFSKATWNQAWRSAAHYQLACLDARKRADQAAFRHLLEALHHNAQLNKAIILRCAIMRRSGHLSASSAVKSLLEIDPLDHWARWELVLCGELPEDDFFAICRNDAQTILDIAFDYEEAGFIDDAARLLEKHLSQLTYPTATPNPLSKSVSVLYVLAWLRKDTSLLEVARKQSPDYFFPSRLQEQFVLEWVIAQPGEDPVANYGLGNFYYDQRRHANAIDAWLRSISDGASFATVFRNLGIGLWNLHRDGIKARAAYLRAIELEPNDPRLVSEYDQLRAKLNDPIHERLTFLENHLDGVLLRDDSTVALASLYNLTHQPEKALALITSRRFHPWEGGEGAVLKQYTTAHLALGKMAMAQGNAAMALEHFVAAMETPDSLGEAYHPLQAKADVNYFKGCALQLLDRNEEAQACLLASAYEAGDFSEMAVTEHSPLSFYRAQSLRALGRGDEALAVFQSLKTHGQNQLLQKARIDYFATSLPNLLVFDEDLQARRNAEAHLLIALADFGLANYDLAAAALADVESFTNADQRAADLAHEMRNKESS